MNNAYNTLHKFALGSAILVMHNAVSETVTGVAVHLYIAPVQIDEIAQ